MTGNASTMTPHAIRFVGRRPFRSAAQRQDAHRLIARLAASPGVFAASAPPAALSLEPLAGGRSAARVFRATPSQDTGGQERRLSVIVKIAPRGEGRREKANYEAFVRDGLPAECRPDLLAYAETGQYAALCYSNAAGEHDATIETLTHHLARGDTRHLPRVLRTLFTPMRDTWCSPDERRTEGDLAHHYLARYFTGARWTYETETALHAAAARYFGARQQAGRTIIAATSFPAPRKLLFASETPRSYVSCILHGDLNTDNIVIAGTGRPALVDFLKTARGHVYRDLVSLEASIRINDPGIPELSEVLDAERRIALGHRPLAGDRYAQAIAKVRRTAIDMFGHVEESANYHFAVAAIGLRLMRAKDLSKLARARITASTLWAAKALAGEPLA